ncbi:MAG: HAD-IIB family hydrolase [Pseudomonadota bacterium]
MKKNALLASDMDGTVIPLESGKEHDEEILRFCRVMRGNPHVSLAYVTGRHLELGLAGVKKYRLPPPDIFVCDVGTTIYLKTGDAWRKDSEYHSRLQKSWKGRTGEDVAQILKNIPELVAQEDEKQEEFKQSYYVTRQIDRETVIAEIHRQLGFSQLRANVIYSVDSIKNVGLIDVLPDIAAKDYALEYLSNKLDINKDDVVYAGDSGNDLLAFISGFNAIVVANTDEDVKAEARIEAQRKNIEARLFFASKKYVSGVMEGCYHFNLFR